MFEPRVRLWLQVERGRNCRTCRSYSGELGISTIMGVLLDLNVEHGWLVLALEADGGHVRWRGSYLDDSVYELLAATVTTVRGRGTRVVFVDEPGCFSLDQTPLESGRLRLALNEHPAWPLTGGGSGTQVALFEVRLRTFAGAVISAVQKLRDELGDPEYLLRWRHGFPDEKLSELRRALRAE